MMVRGIRGAGYILVTALLAATSNISISIAQTQQQATGQQFTFDIPAKPVTQAVNDIGRIAGLSVVSGENRAITASGNAVRGTMTAQGALSTLLNGTGLTYRFSNATTVQILDPSEPTSAGAATPIDGTTVLDTITVEGENGATENSGSYRAETATIGRLSRTLREIPNSVSILTRQTLDDQDLTTVQEAIAATNGATLIKNDDSNERTEFRFRGFTADSLQVDGTSISNNNDVTTFDTVIYDRIEIMKGPAGILQGAREPGGTINLVRKQPTDQAQVKVEGQIGSWHRRRTDIDLSGPLTSDGGVRGRLVGGWDQGNSFIDLVNSERKIVYGVLDFDLTDQTKLTVGGTWQEGSGRNSRGLPAYADGTLLDVPVSTYAGADWDYSKTRSAEVFTKLEHNFDSGAVLNAGITYLDRIRDGKLAFANAPVDPVSGLTKLLPEHRIDRENNFNFDTSIIIPFEVGGLTQKIMIGADYHKTTEELDRARGKNVDFDIFNPNYGIPEPEWNFDRFDQLKSEQYGIYGQAQIKPLDWATVVAGGRFSWWNTRSSDRQTMEETSRASISGEFTPYIAGIIDVSETTSVYASYASIFVPQDAVTSDNKVIDPREGNQYELGVKTELFNGLANASLAIFQIEDTNRAVTDPDDPDFSVASGKVRSRGFEAEINGELLPSWQVTAGYTYLASKFVDDGENSGTVFEPRAPRHSLRIWNKYTFDSGRLEGLSVGGGIRAFSGVYRLDNNVKFQQNGYAVADVQVGYKFNDNVKASLTVTNLFGKKYYQSVGYAERQNYFGDPRAVTFKLSSTF